MLRRNALSLIDVTEEGMVTPVNLLQSLNAQSPIDVTEEGMVMLVILEEMNALSPIAVTGKP
jgi:hypothetical protein